MKLSELLDREVVTRQGEVVGYVADVRLVQDRPLVGPYAAALRVDGIIVGNRQHFRLLGYDRRVGPFYVRALVRYFTGDPRYVTWAQIQSIDDGVVTITPEPGQLPLLRDLPDRPALQP
jgi:sporulation protein YlmC with PRC-barrel domain